MAGQRDLGLPSPSFTERSFNIVEASTRSRHSKQEYKQLLTPEALVYDPFHSDTNNPTSLLRAKYTASILQSSGIKMVAEISAPLHFRTLLNGHQYLIADFYATWCPPCKQIAPIYKQLATAHSSSNFAFVKINVDEQREVAAQYGITAMPTFLVFKDGKQIEEIRGADPRKLKSAIESASADVKSTAAKKEEPKAEAKTEEKKEESEEKTVSGSYGMTGGNSWKMSLH